MVDIKGAMDGLPENRQESVRWSTRSHAACMKVWNIVQRSSIPAILVPVGVQASGKSTFRMNYCADPCRSIVTVSTDDLIEEWGAERGLNYTEAFRQVDFRSMEKAAFAAFDAAVSEGVDIYIDRTNLTPKSRRRWLSRVSTKVLRIAIVFDIPEHVIRYRLDARAAKTGKVIPWNVVETAMKSMVPPSKDEGFNVIVEV